MKQETEKGQKIKIRKYKFTKKIQIDELAFML